MLRIINSGEQKAKKKVLMKTGPEPAKRCSMAGRHAEAAKERHITVTKERTMKTKLLAVLLLAGSSLFAAKYRPLTFRTIRASLGAACIWTSRGIGCPFQ